MYENGWYNKQMLNFPLINIMWQVQISMDCLFKLMLKIIDLFYKRKTGEAKRCRERCQSNKDRNNRNCFFSFRKGILNSLWTMEQHRNNECMNKDFHVNLLFGCHYNSNNPELLILPSFQRQNEYFLFCFLLLFNRIKTWKSQRKSFRQFFPVVPSE